MSTGGHFEYNVGFRRPGETNIIPCFATPTPIKEIALKRLAKIEKQGGQPVFVQDEQTREWKTVKVPVFLIHRFIPEWTESTNGEFSQEQS